MHFVLGCCDQKLRELYWCVLFSCSPQPQSHAGLVQLNPEKSPVGWHCSHFYKMGRISSQAIQRDYTPGWIRLIFLGCWPCMQAVEFRHGAFEPPPAMWSALYLVALQTSSETVLLCDFRMGGERKANCDLPYPPHCTKVRRNLTLNIDDSSPDCLQMMSSIHFFASYHRNTQIFFQN